LYMRSPFSMFREKSTLMLGILGLLASLGGSGCGSGSVQDDSSSAGQLRTIAMAYGKATETLDHPPNNKAELIEVLKEMGYEDPENDVLRSKVDREEFVIHWGFDGRDLRGRPGDMPVLAYEKQGKDGKRRVLQYRWVKEVT